MAILSRTQLQPALLAALACTLSAPALASNGFYLTGYGNESVMMGGADVAVARDAFAANNNPSGMTQISGQTAEVELAVFNNISKYTDSYGNYRKEASNKNGGYTNGAYARQFENTPYAAGIALVVQGGLGWVYSDLNTPFGTQDDASSMFAIVKLAPAVAWKVNDDLSLGVALGINYLAGDQELYPNSPYGIRFKGASGIGLSSKWGLQYRPAKDVTIGMTYGTKTSIPQKNGTLRVNLPGLGVVRYDNAELSGFRLPEELALGISFRPTPSLLVSLQEKWYNWSDALTTLQLSATNPRNPLAPSSYVPPPSAVNFVDQHIIEVGLAYDYDKDTVLMAGVNHGSRPIPDQNVTPIFMPIQARHYMFGVSRKVDKEWQAAVGLEWYAFQSVTFDSSTIFGQNVNARHIGQVLHLSLGRRW